MTFFNGGDVFYFNEHSGNSDDLAHMSDDVLEMAPFVLTHRLICEDDMTPEVALRIAMESPLI